MNDAAWVIVIGALVGVACSLVGVFLVLRRMAMLGDAISHSVLLGIVLALLLSSTRIDWIILLGAGALGVLTAFITDTLHRYGRLQSDASIGVTFTFLFAIGVILTSFLGSDAHIDTDCILYGEIAFAPFDTLTLGGSEIGPRAFWIMLIVTILNSLLVMIGYRSLKIVAFDPVLATTLGLNVAVWHYLLMAAVSMTTVAAFDSVGAILVVAMLVVPANTAYLVCQSLHGMLITSAILGIMSSIGGYYLAESFDASISAGIVLMSGVFFTIAVIYVVVSRRMRSKSIKVLTPGSL